MSRDYHTFEYIWIKVNKTENVCITVESIVKTAFILFFYKNKSTITFKRWFPDLDTIRTC